MTEEPAALLRQAGEAEQAGRFEEAEALIDRVLEVAADLPEAALRKGVMAYRRGRPAEAAAWMERAVASGTAAPHIHRNLCEIYRVLGRHDKALEAGRRAAAAAPDDPLVHLNLSVLHYDRLAMADNIAAAERALALDPDLAGAHFQLAEALLARGDFARGWEEYEWRFRLPGTPQPMLPSDRPHWDGRLMPKGNLLLIADQGYGDSIQFSRYIAWAASRARSLALACSRELQPVLGGIAGIDTIFDRWEDCPPFDAWCPLSGLPRLHGTRGETIPGAPYLLPPASRQGAWRRRLAGLTPPGYRRIGLAWTGRPTHENDRNRSVSLGLLAPLFELDGNAWISLQTEGGRAEIPRYFGRAPLVNLGAEIVDFGDTAAIIAELDLVIAVDTAVVHLAGAMGKPVWILLPYAPDWRWQLERCDSPWYPSATLFRQKAPGDWAPVIAELADRLTALPSPPPRR